MRTALDDVRDSTKALWQALKQHGVESDETADVLRELAGALRDAQSEPRFVGDPPEVMICVAPFRSAFSAKEFLEAVRSADRPEQS